jgi:hypothetical protein
MRSIQATIRTSVSRFGGLFAIALALGCSTPADDDDQGAGAGDAGPTCMPPAELTYSCAPVALGTQGACTGGPVVYDMPQPDTDKAFPVGCEAKFPFCTHAYPNTVQTCVCTNDFTTGQVWSCPI